MVLRRYHGPISDLLSSNEAPHSNLLQPGSDSYDDRGFLNMAISHLQNHRNDTNEIEKQDDPSSLVVTNAEINQPGSDQMPIENNIDTGGPGNIRR